jgi:hypothetical protein
MGFLDRLFGTNSENEYRETTDRVRAASAARSEDEIAVERYRYLLRTAPPETIEKVHEEAFNNLTGEQRKMLFAQLTAEAPRGEAPVADDAHSLAVSATRSEMRRPGTMEKSLANVSAVNGEAGAPAGGSALGGGAPGFGSMFGSSLLGSIAGYVIASTLMSAFLPGPMGADGGGGDAGSGEGGSGDNSSGDSGTADVGGDSSGDFASADGGFDGGFDVGDMGSGFGDFGL